MPSSRTSWVSLLILFSVAAFVETAFFGQISSFTPLYLPKLGVSPERVDDWTGGLMSFVNLFGILFLPFWGALSDRYSRKPVIVRSFVAHIVAIGFMLVSGNIWMFVVGRAAMNLSLGNTGLMMTTLAERAPANRLGVALGVLNGAGTVGAFLGPVAGGRIMDHYSFNALLVINGLVLAGVIAALILGYDDSFKGGQKDSLLTMAGDSVRILFRAGQVRSLFVAFTVLFSGWMLTRTYLPLVVTSLYRGSTPATAVGNIAAAAGIAAMIGGPLIGALSDRYGHWRMLLIGAIVQVLLWPLPAFAWSIASLAIAWAFLNSVLAAVFSVSFAVLTSAAPSEVRGRVMSYAYLPLSVGLVFGPLLATPVVDRFGIMSIFPLSALLTLVSVVLLARARPVRTPIT
jgi:DHA1 family multidrug resistance protein-like MFS transporter